MAKEPEARMVEGSSNANASSMSNDKIVEDPAVDGVEAPEGSFEPTRELTQTDHLNAKLLNSFKSNMPPQFMNLGDDANDDWNHDFNGDDTPEKAADIKELATRIHEKIDLAGK